MFEYLEQLRQKPVSVRKRVAFLVALSFAGFIFVIWASVIYPDFRKDQALESHVISHEPSPITTLGSQIGDSVSQITNKFGDLKNLFSFFTDPTHFSAETGTTSDTIATSTTY